MGILKIRVIREIRDQPSLRPRRKRVLAEDAGEVREFVRIAPAGDDAGQPVRRPEMLRDLGPALRQPVLFRPCRAGMDYRERAGDAVRAEDFFRLRSGAFRHAQLGQRRGFDACHGGGEVEEGR